MKQEYLEIPLNQINVVSNYRKSFNDKSLKELADSIKENGILEPVIVRRNGKLFEMVAGERRLKAAHLAGLVTVPAIVNEVSDKDVLKVQLIENIQREGVQYMEEAYGLRDLRDKCDLDIREIARFIGKSEVYVDYMLKMTQMSSEAQEAARNGRISKSVAIHIARLPNSDYQDQATRDLSRLKQRDLITESGAKKYIQRNFSTLGLGQPRKSPLVKQNGNDYAANWKKYLLGFSSPQFEYFKSIARGRTETHIFAEAVEAVMKEKSVVTV